jgi:hypothetical protein
MALSSGLSEARAAILLERLFRDDQRDEFALGDLQGREGVHALGIVVAAADGVIFDRQVQPVAHEVEIALDGFGADFQVASERGGVREAVRGQRLVDA